MPTEEDLKKETAKEPESAEAELSPREESAEAEVQGGQGSALEAAASERDEEADEGDEVVAPTQLGTRRFVYAAYFAAGITVAFLLSKVVTLVWTRLALYKPAFGEPHDEVVMPIAALVGTLVAVYYWRDQSTRTLVEEVASELSKVTWPTRQDVVNSTFVVIVTTLVATTFFALMDRFWGFVTNLVYGA
jgi:preprotein translocase subunit SecE